MKNPLIGTGGVDSMTVVLAALEWKKRNEPKEQRLERERRQKEEEEQRISVSFIQKGQCPICQSKLLRGKRDKKMDYKRTWQCSDCTKTFWM